MKGMNTKNRSEFFLKSAKEKDAYEIKEKTVASFRIRDLMKNTSLRTAVLLSEILKRPDE
jgi:phage pi2 protein 07